MTKDDKPDKKPLVLHADLGLSAWLKSLPPEALQPGSVLEINGKVFPVKPQTVSKTEVPEGQHMETDTELRDNLRAFATWLDAEVAALNAQIAETHRDPDGGNDLRTRLKTERGGICAVQSMMHAKLGKYLPE